ncbi:MAG: anti-sigma factor antagonist [Anaerolineae bacterium]|nr:anti-sigma factor antagonist [Anaerolineae bacterium]MEB2289329.1 anti-sigma factor antagonist [Anaerolineae bacterium]
MAETSHLAIPARLEDIRQACDFVVEAAEQAGLGERAVYHCQMAVDEALTNIIEHGFAYSDDSSQIEIACRTEPDRFIVAIADSSPAFNPLLHESPDPSEPLDSREPGGWGIYFIRKLMDEVTYERAGGRNLLTLVKLIATARHAAASGGGEDAPVPVRVLDAQTAVISPAGRLDSNTSIYLEHALDAQLASGRTQLYVDLTAVEYIASNGLKVLIAAWRRARENGGDVVLSGLQPRLVEIFAMVGFDMLFQVFPDLDAALAARQARR